MSALITDLLKKVCAVTVSDNTLESVGFLQN